MRVNELNAQIEAVEQALKRLQKDALNTAWLVFPFSRGPAPDFTVIQRWLTEAGLPDDTEVRCRPGRYNAATPLLSLPGFSGELPDGWELVEAAISSPASGKKGEPVWVHPTLTQRYRQWLENRPPKAA